MRVSAIRILDDRFMEFIEALQSLGELQNVIKLIAHLSSADEPPEDVDLDLREVEASTTMRALWENGWIEVREVKRQSKGILRRAYMLRINLEKIARYFEQEKVQRSILAREAIPQEAQALS